MNIFLILIISLATLYSCSPVNKQHGYLLDDIVISAEKISEFETDKTTKNDIFAAMGSPSIEIDDINDVWIYLISLKEKKVFEEDLVKYQSIMKFAFNENNILIENQVLTSEDFNEIRFSTDKTKVRRDAYGITDQLYDAFTRGQ